VPNFPSNWSQQAANNLRAIARSAVQYAEDTPGDEINPFYGKMQSSVMYDEDTGHYVIEFCQPGGHLNTLRRLTPEEAAESLTNGWGHELYYGHALSNPYEIVRDDILGAMGEMADWR
jgi:hypothetical protein